MPQGPIELLTIEVPGSRFTGEIAPALTEPVENGTIRVIDVLVVKKDAAGNVTGMELADLIDPEFEVEATRTRRIADRTIRADASPCGAAHIQLEGREQWRWIFSSAS